MKRTSVIILAGMLCGSGLGCPGTVTPPDATDSKVDGNRDPAEPQPGEPNGAFALAIAAVFNTSGVARLQGTVEQVGDLDVYELGPLGAGDRVVVDAYAFNSLLDVTVALFDGEERLVMNNDDRADGQSLDALFDFFVRHGSDNYYLVVSNSPFASTRSLSGGYRVDVEVSTSQGVPPPAPQTIVLDFDGANIDSPVLGTFTLGPFEASDISTQYEGETEFVKERIREVFQQNYERFDVLVLTSDDPAPAPGTEYTTIFLGGFDPNLFGIAEAVDLYDLERCDDAIIYTESFSPAVFSRTPTAEQLGTAIGNVAAHEAGHLLGLNHTDDDLDIMDDSSPADAFLADQEFTIAPLSGDIMSIGQQDGVLLLNEIVGPG
jgi:hypothetical protein